MLMDTKYVPVRLSGPEMTIMLSYDLLLFANCNGYV